MKMKVKIKSYSVLSNSISIKLLSDSPHGLVHEAKDEKRKVGLDGLYFEAKIKSVNLQREVANILLRAKKNRYIVLKLFDLMGKDSLELSFFEACDTELLTLLKKVSLLQGRSEEEVLYGLTSFRDKNGNEVPGKRTVDELSDLQKEIVLRKLRWAARNGKKEVGEECSVS